MRGSEAFKLFIIRESNKKDDNKQLSPYKEEEWEKYDYNSVAANSELSSREIADFCNLRGQYEHFIKTVKRDFGLRKLPSGIFEADALRNKEGFLAYNAFRLFLIATNPNKSLKTIRSAIFSIAGHMVKHVDKISLKLFPEDDKFNLCSSLKKNVLIYKNIFLFCKYKNVRLRQP